MEKELINGRVAKEMTEELKEVRKGPRAANLTGTVTRTRESLEAKAKVKQEQNPILLRMWRARVHRSEWSIQVDQQHGRRRRPRFIVGERA